VTRRLLATFAATLVAVSTAGCGLKGPLTVPEKSGSVVVRDKQTSGEPSGAPATQAPQAPKRPPPVLPRSENATGRGG